MAISSVYRKYIYAGVDANGDIVKQLNSTVDWSLFEPTLKKEFSRDKNK